MSRVGSVVSGFDIRKNEPASGVVLYGSMEYAVVNKLNQNGMPHRDKTILRLDMNKE